MIDEKGVSDEPDLLFDQSIETPTSALVRRELEAATESHPGLATYTSAKSVHLICGRIKWG